MFNWFKKKKPKKKDEDVNLKIQLGDEELNVTLTREQMLLLTHEAAEYGRSAEEHIRQLLWEEYKKENE